MFKKVIVFCICITLIFTLFSVGCTSNQDTDSDKGGQQETSESKNDDAKSDKTVKEEPGVVKVIAWDTLPPGSPSLESSKVVKEIEKALNIDIEFELFPLSEGEDMLRIRLATGSDMPDIFFSEQLQPEQLAATNTIVPLSDYFDTLMPNVAEEIARDDVLRPQVKSLDGKIYFLPMRQNSRRNLKTWNIRKDWLDELDLAVPETPDELYNVLKAFKQRDTECIPVIENHYVYTWMHMCYFFGLNIYQAWDQLGFDNETKQFFVYTLQPEFREVMEYVSKLYQEGLFNQDLLNVTPEVYNNHIFNGKVGLLFQTPAMTDVDKIKELNPESKVEYVGILPPVVPGRERGVRSYTVLQGKYFVSEKGENKADAMRLMDYVFADPEGARIYNLGFEGETYIEENGEYTWTDFVLENPAGLPPLQAATSYGLSMAQYLPFTQVLPGVEYPSFYKDTDHWGNKAIELYENAGFIRPELQLRLTEEESARQQEIFNNAINYFHETNVQFLIGDKSFDEWDEFQSELERLGVKEVAEIYQTAYDRAFKK